MNIKITNRRSHSKGEIFILEIQNKKIEILFQFHALERIKKWEIK